MEALLEYTSQAEQEIARKSLKIVDQKEKKLKAVASVKLTIGGGEEIISVPKKVIHYLSIILNTMAEGKGVSIMPADAEMTTQQVANILNVSRPFVIKLLDDGLISYRKVGTHRRVKVEDVVTYASKMKDQRRASLEFLANQAQELGMGY